MRRYIVTFSLGVLAIGGCNSLDERGSDTGAKLVIPRDTRATVQALRTPPPISGGTLAISPDGAFAVAADPDRDRISIVNLASREVRQVALEQGDEPGRVVVDPSGRAHVALRRGGAVVGVDLQSGALLSRVPVCSAPRGIAYDASQDFVHVACADGWLVSLAAADGRVARSLELGTDLRDVVVIQDQLLVTTFKNAELLVLDAQGALVERTRAPRVDSFMTTTDEQGNPIEQVHSMLPHQAWRAVPTADGRVLMLHQRASESEIDIDRKPEPEAPSAYGGGGSSNGFPGPAAGCAGIVQAGATLIGRGGSGSTMALGAGLLAVDVAVSPLDGSFATAQAGLADPEAPKPFVVFDTGDEAVPQAAGERAPSISGGNVTWFDRAMLPQTPFSAQTPEHIGTNCASPALNMPMPGQATAVAFTPGGTLVAQSREPALLAVLPDPRVGRSTIDIIDLGGESVRDTGHDLFHRDTGAGIACASCHGEAADDGHVWHFSGLGPRRTQAVHVGLEGTAPFHWNGEMKSFGMLIERVFVGRMGGVHESDQRLDALSGWLFAQRPPAPIVAADEPAAQRGKALFESAEIGCTSCHSGAALTNNGSYDVGTGERVQVPSLRGVGYRAPFIHTGCAQSLRDRFDPSCGGDRHGQTDDLSDAEIDDLVAYLRSI